MGVQHSGVKSQCGHQKWMVLQRSPVGSLPLGGMSITGAQRHRAPVRAYIGLRPDVMSARRGRQKVRLQTSEARVVQLSEELQEMRVKRVGEPLLPPSKTPAHVLRQRCRLRSVRCAWCCTPLAECLAPAAARSCCMQPRAFGGLARGSDRSSSAAGIA